MKRPWFLALLCGCRTVLAPAQTTEPLQTPSGSFVVAFDGPDVATARQVEAAIVAAEPRLSQWGRLSAPVTIRILESHQMLEDVLGWPGEQLSAWATYDQILLQSPRTWHDASPGAVKAMVLHELTHSLMYQRINADADHHNQTPLWFREGMAIWTAGQGDAFEAMLPALRRTFAAGKDPIFDPEASYLKDIDLNYCAGFHAFDALQRRAGTDGIRRLLDAMRAGATFDAAFRTATGEELAAFAKAFRESL